MIYNILLFILSLVFIFYSLNYISKEDRETIFTPYIKFSEPYASKQPNSTFCNTDLQCKERYSNGDAKCINFSCSLSDNSQDSVSCNNKNNCFKIFTADPILGELYTTCLSYNNQLYTGDSGCEESQILNCNGRFINDICIPTDQNNLAIQIPYPFASGYTWITVINNSAGQRIKESILSDQR